MNTEDMDHIADLIYRAATDFEAQQDTIRAEVDALCKKNPLYE